MQAAKTVGVTCLGFAVLLSAGSAGAFDTDFLDGDIGLRLNSKLSVGAAWRMQDRDHDLIGGLNLNPGLCDGKNCLFEENDALVAAPGAFSGVNGDDGNLNYDKYDVVAATSKLNSDLSISWRDYLVRVHAIAFFDPVNVNFEETHSDTRHQPARSPRPGSIEEVYASGVNLYEAYLLRNFDWFGRSAVVTIGNQLVRWGESTLVALNSLSEINPPNAAIFRMPGVELNELFQPVPLVLLSTDVMPGVTAELIYQFGWQPVQPDPRGSFMSDSDLIGGRNAYITLGQFGENPNDEAVLVPFNSMTMEGNPLEAISSTSVTTYLGRPNEPADAGQYGARINYFAEWLNHGTDLSFYYLNYHSRLPYASITATNASCARDSTNIAQASGACNGFNGSLNPALGGERGDPFDTTMEPLPIQTLGARLTYPEGIRMYGFSFNTNLGSWSLAGEYSYRPNVPMQIHLTDLIFMGLNPAFPEVDIPIPGVGSIPAAQNAIPSYLLTYRGRSYTDNATRVQPNEQIAGYERMAVEQLDFTGIKAFSSNPFGAEQVLIIAEAGLTHVKGMPDISTLQFEGGGPNRTHYSPGADGSGADGVKDTRRLNPHQQTDGFATEYSWGLRAITRLEYNDVVFGWNFLPTVIGAWDISGIAPYPLQNFVEGRKEFTAGTEVQFTQNLSGRVLYQWFTGGGRDNTRKDRDNASLSFSYAF